MTGRIASDRRGSRPRTRRRARRGEPESRDRPPGRPSSRRAPSRRAAGPADLGELVQVADLALEVGLLRPLGGGADDHAGVAEIEPLEQLCAAAGARSRGGALRRRSRRPKACRRGSGRRPKAASRGARPCLQRVLDGLDDDLLAGLDQLVDAAPASAPALRGGFAGLEHDLVDVQEAVSLEADVDEGGFHAGKDVVDRPL